jgi:hypothetical protein
VVVLKRFPVEKLTMTMLQVMLVCCCRCVYRKTIGHCVSVCCCCWLLLLSLLLMLLFLLLLHMMLLCLVAAVLVLLLSGEAGELRLAWTMVN